MNFRNEKTRSEISDRVLFGSGPDLNRRPSGYENDFWYNIISAQ